MTFGLVEIADITVDYTTSNNEPVTELNGLTLKELFEENNLISDMTLFIKAPSNSTLTLTDDIYTMNKETTIMTYYKVQTVTLNNKYYIKTFMKRNIEDYTQTVIFRTQWTNSIGYYLLNNMNWQEFSAIYVADVGTGQTRFQSSSNTSQTHDISFKKSYLIDLNALGIDSLTVSQLDDYYDYYISNQSRELPYDYTLNELTLTDLILILTCTILWFIGITIVERTFQNV
jgi:hypothetical protein